jgi:nitrous oxide reductase accessory protein NosL
VVEVYVTEYYTTRAVRADKAFFVVGSDVMGPMGRELVPIGNEEDARTFSTDHGGDRIFTFDQVTLADIPD